MTTTGHGSGGHVGHLVQDVAPADASDTCCRTWPPRTCRTPGAGRVCAGLVAVVALVAAGCGGAAKERAAPTPPKLPRALAQSWARQADAIAAAVASGDGCAAQLRAIALRTEVVGAVNERRVARRYLESLVGAVNDLAGRITCTPAPAPKQPKPNEHDKPKKHDKHGKGGD